MGDLALQVGELDPVVVDHAERADARGGEVEQERRAEAAGADQQDLGLEQARLADAADLRQHDVPGVAQHLLLGEGRRIRRSSRLRPAVAGRR